MKITHFVLVIVFLFTCAVSPAQAQAGGREVFIPLVTEADPNVPLWMQAQQAYETLLPKLIAAKRKGEILEFRSEPSVGILGIKYASGARAFAFGNQQEISDLNAALALVPKTPATRATPEATGAFFDMTLYSSCYTISDLPNKEIVKAVMYDKTGNLLATSSTQASSGGASGCFYPWQQIMPGYKLTYKIYDTTGASLLGTYTSGVPAMGITEINRAEGSIGGYAPAGKFYTASWYHRELDVNRTYRAMGKADTVPADKHWLVDLSNEVSIRGGDFLMLELMQRNRFLFTDFRYAPAVSCDSIEIGCWGYAAPSQNITMSIMQAGKLYSFSTRTGVRGDFYIDLYDSQHNRIYLTKGDKIKVTGVEQLTIPNMTATVNFATDVVSGAVPMNTYFYLGVVTYLPGTGTVYRSRWTTSKPFKNFYAEDFSDFIDLKADDLFTVDLSYTDPQTGNKFYLSLPFAP